jgi:hypothetical protein
VVGVLSVTFSLGATLVVIEAADYGDILRGFVLPRPSIANFMQGLGGHGQRRKQIPTRG